VRGERRELVGFLARQFALFDKAGNIEGNFNRSSVTGLPTSIIG
jgi:hypothetical protein